MTTAAVVNICSDPRLEQGTIRLQVRSRLERLGLRADFIYLTSGAGGIIEAGLRDRVEQSLSQGEEIVFAAVLDHDDCQAAKRTLRPLEANAEQLEACLMERGIHCGVVTGSIRSATSSIVWEEEPVALRAQSNGPAKTERRRSLFAPVAGLAAICMALVVVAFIAVAVGSRTGEKESAVEVAAAPITRPAAPAVVAVSPVTMRTSDGRVLVTDPKTDCLAEDMAPIDCAIGGLDLTSLEAWSQGDSLFIVVTANEGGFEKLDSYGLSFAFDLDRNPETRLSRRFEANGLGHELDVRLAKEELQMSVRITVRNGVSAPVPHWTADQNRIELELSRFPVEEFEMLVWLEMDDVQDVIPNGGKLSLPEGRLIPK